MSDRPTRYVWELSCEDVGEYDGAFIAEISAAIAKVIGNSGIVGFTLRTERRRPGEF